LFLRKVSCRGMSTSVNATKLFWYEPQDAFSSNNLVYTYWRQCGAYARLIEWIKLLCSRNRSVNVKAMRRKMRVGLCARPMDLSDL